jgi:hypothetical protein
LPEVRLTRTNSKSAAACSGTESILPELRSGVVFLFLAIVAALMGLL